jgi:eukaryotic-like serine/threonine-protein kinase
MGEVYRARDNRLDRDVAVKVLPAVVANNPDRLARFEREAKAVAALSHPNILAVFDTGHDDGRAFVVTELLEGETLAAALGRGPLPRSQALDIGVQLARGLAAAHQKGLVHRDLKPDNVFLLPDGQVKILDFGLARQAGSSDAEVTSLPTTDPGMVLGTLGYMAPEQARGQQVDARADLFSFGALLYEMLSGRPAFRRVTAADTMTAVLTADPLPLDAVDLQVPIALQRVVERCLAKNREQRFQSAKDLAFALETSKGSSSGSGDRLAPAPPSRRAVIRALAPWAVAAIAVMGLLAVVLLKRGQPVPDAAGVTFEIPPARNTESSYVTLSPDGRRLLLRVSEAGGQRKLWLRSLDSLIAQPLAGTEEAERPFWSPDGRSVAFFTGKQLKKVDLASGTAQVLVDTGVGTANGGAWGARGDVIYSASLASLSRVAAEGGRPQSLTTLDTGHHETRHYFPSMLPDGDHFLFVITSDDVDTRGLWVASVSDPTTKRRLLPDLSQGQYADGYVLFVRGGALMAQPFDPVRLVFSSQAQPIVGKVSYNPVLGYGDFSVSGTTLTYLPDAVPWRLTWFDRTGRSLGAFGAGGSYNSIALSPDGTRVAVDGPLRLEPYYELTVVDQSRGTTTQVTFGANSGNFPVWSADGATLAFGSNRSGHYDIYRKPAQTSGGEEVLLASGHNKFVMDWSRDGRWLLYGDTDPATLKESLWTLPMTGDRKPVMYLPSTADRRDGRFSPDGRFVAYSSDESSSSVQVFVETFPAGGGKWQISTNGGARPVWRADGGELYYLSPHAELMAVPIALTPLFTPGTPVKLFDSWARGFLTGYAVSRDGQRFVMNAPGDDVVPTPATVILNWPTLLKK